MDDSSINIESVVARIITDKPVRKTPYQVKGVFIRQYPKEPIIPMLNGTYRDKFLYPRVQVKILNEQIYIIGIQEGVAPVLSLLENFDIFDFGNITFKVQSSDIEKGEKQFILTDRLIRYRFITPWVALNQMTGEKYRNLPNEEKQSYLNRLIGQNILFLAKELGDKPSNKVYSKVKLSSLFPKPVDENKWGAFTGEFKTNYLLPSYIGLGNGITRGYGTIYGMFNPDSFSFDEEKLKKEVVGAQAETFSEENRIDSVEPNEVPRPKRKSKRKWKNKIQKTKNKINKKPKISSKKKPKSPGIYFGDFEIDRGNSKGKNTNEKNKESLDDSRFNTEKHHKRQHKF